MTAVMTRPMIGSASFKAQIATTAALATTPSLTKPVDAGVLSAQCSLVAFSEGGESSGSAVAFAGRC